MTSTKAALDVAHERVVELIGHFAAHESTYLSPRYQEAEARKDFIDPFLKALGWDVDHEKQRNPYEQEVKVERTVSVAKQQKRADYAFYLHPNYREVRFFVEAKKPSIDLHKSAESHFQTLRYGYSSNTPLAVLTDFEQILVLDCRLAPKAEFALDHVHRSWHYKEFLNKDRFAEFYWLFSREAHADGSYQRRIDELLPLSKGGARHRRLFKDASLPVDDRFLSELEEYRMALARAFYKANSQLSPAELTEFVQRTLDRLVFLRFLEDKQIETEISVSTLGKRRSAWQDFKRSCSRLDGIYNGIVFKPLHPMDDEVFEIEDAVFADICERISSENASYTFASIPIHILGSIYERFLGSTIEITNGKVTVEEKLEVRKAGGVYYTPEPIVRYIVASTVGASIVGKTPAQISKMRFADIACGSGSFLLGVYDCLLVYLAGYYNEPANLKQAKRDGCVLNEDGLWRLTLAQRRAIMQLNIYGVDIDRQAVEVGQMSLFLKLLEDERATSAKQYQLDYARDPRLKRLLPDMSANVVSGNSLIGWTKEVTGLPADQQETLNPMDFAEAFPAVMAVGGFHSIVGNPPYLSIDDTWGGKDCRLVAVKHAYPHIHNDKTDLLFYFFARAIELARHSVSFIVSRAFLEAFKADKLRAHLLESARVDQIVDFRNTMIFKNVAIATCIVTLSPGAKAGTIDVRKHLKKALRSDSLGVDLDDPEEFSQLKVKQSKLGSAPWELSTSSVAAINAKIDAIGTPLGDFLTMGQGMQTGLNSVFGKRTAEEIKRWRVPVGQVFMRATNSDIQRYVITQTDEFILYPNAAGKFNELPAGVQAHLREHETKLRERVAFKRGNCEWFKYTWPLHAEKYGRSKRILCPYLAQSNRFAIDHDDKFLSLTDSTVLFDGDQPENILYLLAVLNSKLMTFRFRSIGKLKGGGIYEYFENSVARLRIKRIDMKNKAEKDAHDELVQLCEKITEALKELAGPIQPNPIMHKRKVAAIDRQIDETVYKLYGLIDDEIKVVELEMAEG